MKRLLLFLGALVCCVSPAFGWSWTLSRDLTFIGWDSGFTLLGDFVTLGPWSGNTSCTLSAAGMVYDTAFGANVVANMRVNTVFPPQYSEYFGADTSGNWVYQVETTASSGGLITVRHKVGSVITSVATATFSGGWLSNLKTVINNNVLGVFLDGTLLLKIPVETFTGKVGFSACQATSSTGIKYVNLGTPESVPPNPVPSGSIGASPFVNHVDLQWPVSSDDASGIGVLGYQVLKFGQAITAMPSTALTFSDPTVIPSSTYSYVIRTVDGFFNYADSNPVIVQTPAIQTNPPYPSQYPEGRSVGTRTTGTYWGGGGENIDVRTGNLSFSVPVVTARAATGWAVPFRMSYNSQNWRQDSGGTWMFDSDVGYGFGWRLMAGSITPVWNAGGTAATLYFFTDASGAEYRLDQNTGNVWSSKESVYVWFDANSNTLYFRDGSSWYMGCVSYSTEADAGAMYPTLMKDISGNTITVTYKPASGSGWTNSSARIDKITDPRAPSGSYTYLFQYGYDTTPWHLFSVSNNIGSGEGLSTSLSGFQNVTAPFGSMTASVRILNSISFSIGTQQFGFTYNSAGEMTKITLPSGGYTAYDYSTVTYSSGRSYREVTNRYLSKNGTTQTTYPFTHEASPGPDVHSFTQLTDPGGVGQKYWTFSTSGANMGLVTQYQGQQLPGPVVKTQSDFTWSQDAVGNSYISSTITTADPGANQAQKKVTQTVDTYGNVTQVQIFNYGNLSTAARTNTYTYSTNSGLLAAYIRNRMLTASVSDGTNTKTLVTNTYGTTAGQNSWGRVTSSQTLTGTRTITYDAKGNVASSSLNGITSSLTMDATGSVPTQLTVGSLTQTMAYSNSFLGLTSTTGPNSDQTQIGYQDIAHPSSTTSALGTTTNITYAFAPSVVTAVVNGRWTRTTSDGLGRTIKAEVGTGATNTTPVSITETEYDSCGCSPTGKMKRTSLPHASGASALWTTYTYDGIGRTLSVLAPDGASTSTYAYLGNSVTVTDPAGKWKKYTSDAFGRLTQVNEPNPAGGSDYVTTYTYDLLDHLIGVSMPRATGTQTRTFNYGTPPGPFLQSATNPENGTVSYSYDSQNRLYTKTDAKGQKTQFNYDSYNRVNAIIHYFSGNTEDPQQRVNYYYDVDAPFTPAGYGTYLIGRLSGLQYYGGHCTALGPPRTGCDLLQESYKYDIAGNLLGKKLKITRGSASGALTSTITYDAEGRVTQVLYPGWQCSGCTTRVGSKYNFGYDTLGRLNTMKNAYTNANLVSGISYGVANEMLSMSGILSETRTYNSMFQLTRITVPSTLDIQYNYSATQNNGKITDQTDIISGEQITYTYDSLNRLASAQTTTNPLVTQWGQSYTYDGFGNLTDQTVIKGSAPSMSVTYNASTNRQTGDTADANGNIGLNYIYDIENRLLRPGAAGSTTPEYGYDAGNKRVWRGSTSPAMDELTFWSGNQKWATYQLLVSGSMIYFTLTGTNVYFGGRMIGKGTYNSGGTNDKVTIASISQDRLGSMNGKFYPYGQERPSATTNDKEKFTGYFRDSATGLDYADQRYHNPGQGRFMTPDPLGGSAQVSNPGSWNRYAYTEGDPVNRVDPRGTCDTSSYDLGDCSSGGGWAPLGNWGWGSFGVYDNGGYYYSVWGQYVEFEDGVWVDVWGWEATTLAPADQQRSRRFFIAPGSILDMESQNSLMLRALNRASEMLAEPACGMLFSADDVDPAELLRSLFQGTSSYGVLAFSQDPQTWIAQNNPTDYRSVYATTAPFVGADGGQSGSVILLNPFVGGAFASASATDQARTLLHELGHLYYNIFGAGSTPIRPDNMTVDTDGSIEARNQFLIRDNCK